MQSSLAITRAAEYLEIMSLEFLEIMSKTCVFKLFSRMVLAAYILFVFSCPAKSI